MNEYKFNAGQKCIKSVKRMASTFTNAHARGVYVRTMMDAQRTYDTNKKKKSKEKESEE